MMTFLCSPTNLCNVADDPPPRGRLSTSRPPANPTRSSMVLLRGPDLNPGQFSFDFVTLHLLASFPSTSLWVTFTSIGLETSLAQCEIEEPLCLPSELRGEVTAQRDADWKKLKGISCFYKGTFVRNGNWVLGWSALFSSVMLFP